MLKLSSARTALMLFSGTLAIATVACTSDRAQVNRLENVPATIKNSPSAAEDLNTASSTIQPPVSETTPQTTSDSRFDLALDKAAAADSISQSAQSADDWNLVVSQWLDAIALMQAVPADSPYKSIAQKKIAEYQQKLADAAKQRKLRAAIPPPEPPVNLIPAPMNSPEFSPEIAATVATPPSPIQPPVFQVPIKRRDSGTPVIDVTFNGTEQFEMIVDTGASGTVITQQIATALGVVPVTTAKANTASATGVEFPIGYVESIDVGGAVQSNIAVAIAPTPELQTGLLGHDFFSDYDITFKRETIEFRARP